MIQRPPYPGRQNKKRMEQHRPLGESRRKQARNASVVASSDHEQPVVVETCVKKSLKITNRIIMETA